jgi:hypothetical protein
MQQGVSAQTAGPTAAVPSLLHCQEHAMPFIRRLIATTVAASLALSTLPL